MSILDRLNPEQRARVRIDEMLEAAGWNGAAGVFASYPDTAGAFRVEPSWSGADAHGAFLGLARVHCGSPAGPTPGRMRSDVRGA
jgi:hypothetical protein